jgi:hypothetical protein
MIAGKLRGGGISIPSGDAFYSSTGTNTTFTVPANVTKICIAMTTGTSSNSAGGKMSVVRNSNSTWLAAAAKYISPTYTSSVSGLILPIAAGVVGVVGKGGNASTSAPTFQMNLTYNIHTYTHNGAPYNVPPNPVYLGGSSIPPAYISVVDTNGRYVSIPGDGNGNYNGTAYRATDIAGNPTAAMSFGYSVVSSGGSTVPGTNTSLVISGSGGTQTFVGASTGTTSVGSNSLVPASTQTSVEKTISITIGSVSGWLYYSYDAQRSNTLGVSDYSYQRSATISGNIIYSGGDTGNITSHVNDLTVTPGETFTVKIGSGTGQAVRFMWGTGRSFPSNSA